MLALLSCGPLACIKPGSKPMALCEACDDEFPDCSSTAPPSFDSGAAINDSEQELDLGSLGTSDEHCASQPERQFSLSELPISCPEQPTQRTSASTVSSVPSMPGPCLTGTENSRISRVASLASDAFQAAKSTASDLAFDMRSRCDESIDRIVQASATRNKLPWQTGKDRVFAAHKAGTDATAPRFAAGKTRLSLERRDLFGNSGGQKAKSEDALNAMLQQINSAPRDIYSDLGSSRWSCDSWSTDEMLKASRSSFDITGSWADSTLNSEFWRGIETQRLG